MAEFSEVEFNEVQPCERIRPGMNGNGWAMGVRW